LAVSSGVGAAIVQWDDPFEYRGDGSVGPSVGKFQAWIYNTVSDERPEATYEYESLGALPGLATIGSENLAGTQATTHVNAGDPSGAITAGGTLCLDYVGPSFEPVTLSYEVTVRPNAKPGTYTNEAVHVTD